MDTIKITILEDGTIRTETDTISAPNHKSAETFMAQTEKLAGGKVTTVDKRKSLHQHRGQDAHQH